MTYAYVGLGSNRGRPRAHLGAARRLLKGIPGARLAATSPTYRSAPVGCPGRQNYYYNAVAELQTTLPPPRVFRHLRTLERRIQKKPRVQNAARRLDVDYLAHGACRRRAAALTLPHPQLYRRAFVLQPLYDILIGSRSRAPSQAAVSRALRKCRHQALCRLS